MRAVRFSFLIGLLCFLALPAIGQQRPTHELHSMMIYNFLKYIEWPGGKNTGEFVIGVIDDDQVYNTLNTWYGNKTRGNKTFKIVKASSSDDLTQYQLVYLGKGGSDSLDGVLSKVADQPVLTVTAKKGLAAKGSCINFRVIDNRLKFELNQSAISKTTLKASSQLAAMAIVI